MPASLFGTMPAAFEAHAVDTLQDPPEVHVVKIQRGGDADEDLYRLACALAQSIGVELEG